MTSLNKMMAIGNLGTDPEMRYTPNGNAVTSFRLATTRSYNSPDGERRQETEWFTVVTWNRLAELCNQYLTKGKRVLVEGRLETRSATRSLALRLRGLAASSASLATSGFFVNTFSRSSLRKASFTRRSSSE